jgi:hypothetical protein
MASRRAPPRRVSRARALLAAACAAACASCASGYAWGGSGGSSVEQQTPASALLYTPFVALPTQARAHARRTPQRCAAAAARASARRCGL